MSLSHKFRRIISSIYTGKNFFRFQLFFWGWKCHSHIPGHFYSDFYCLYTFPVSFSSPKKLQPCKTHPKEKKMQACWSSKNNSGLPFFRVPEFASLKKKLRRRFLSSLTPFPPFLLLRGTGRDSILLWQSTEPRVFSLTPKTSRGNIRQKTFYFFAILPVIKCGKFAEKSF